jgi:predicted glycoside hydrolase/deacetylase ChbG (UPF0249 family)
MTGARYLIVNADDFGRSPGVNRGIMRTHQHGIVTSASLMVRWPAAVEAAVYARMHPTLSVGLHLDLGEWFYRNSNWDVLYQVVDLDDAFAVRQELTRQLDGFRNVMGREPSHIDSHQHLHQKQPVRTAALEAAHQFGIPLRDCCPGVQYCGRFYGQTAEGYPYPEGISVDALLSLLAELPKGITEIGCHPGEGQDLETMYLTEREEELKVLCDPRIASALVELGIQLCSFNDVTSFSAAERATQV